MLNILVPLAGESRHFPEDVYVFGQHLIEINGEPLIAHVVDGLRHYRRPSRFLFVISKRAASKYYLDHTLDLLTDKAGAIIVQHRDARGAVCSCLLAIDEINNDTPLLISNGDQVIDADLTGIIDEFDRRDLDAGVVTFQAMHPRWSYIDQDPHTGLVMEAVEKRPISRHAIAGLYYFRRGRDFVESAMRSIERNEKVLDRFFIAPCLNELILMDRRVGAVEVPRERYHSLYTPQLVQDYEALLKRRQALPTQRAA